MKFAIISGSHREDSQSEKVSQFIRTQIKSLYQRSETYLFNLKQNPLPLWDESVWSGGEVWQERWQPVAEQLQSSQALIWVVPEWNGMIPSGVLNLLHLCGQKEVGHKPALIVSVSASRNGAYPISLMRQATTKNNRMVYIPEHVIVRDVKSMMNGEKPQSKDEEYLLNRLNYSLRLLNSYALALSTVRESGVIRAEEYPNGM